MDNLKARAPFQSLQFPRHGTLTMSRFSDSTEAMIENFHSISIDLDSTPLSHLQSPSTKAAHARLDAPLERLSRVRQRLVDATDRLLAPANGEEEPPSSAQELMVLLQELQREQRLKMNRIEELLLLEDHRNYRIRHPRQTHKTGDDHAYEHGTRTEQGMEENYDTRVAYTTSVHFPCTRESSDKNTAETQEQESQTSNQVEAGGINQVAAEEDHYEEDTESPPSKPTQNFGSLSPSTTPGRLFTVPEVDHETDTSTPAQPNSDSDLYKSPRESSFGGGGTKGTPACQPSASAGNAWEKIVTQPTGTHSHTNEDDDSGYMEDVESEFGVIEEDEARKDPSVGNSGLEDYDDDDDDSALYCATVKVEDRSTRERWTAPVASAIPPVATSPTNISHIQFDEAVPSPAPTVLTMDTTLGMHEFPLGSSLPLEKDRTPVLERYRLDRDDESPDGFRVVPNHNSNSPRTGDTTRKQHAPNLQTPSLTQRLKKVYRKTPYAKRRTSSAESNSSSEVYSPLPHQHSTPREFAEDSLSPSLLYARASSLIVTPQFQSSREHDLPRVPSKAQSVEGSMFSHDAKIPTTECTDTILAQVDLREYATAPRIVRMQVALQEVQLAVSTLNEFMDLTGVESLEESQLQDILKTAGCKSLPKSLIMSLCHFRRLVMHRTDGQQRIFTLPTSAEKRAQS